MDAKTWRSALEADLIVKELVLFESNVLYFGYYGEIVEATSFGAPYAARLLSLRVGKRELHNVARWGRLRHPNVVQTQGVSLQGDCGAWLVTEKMSVNLNELIHVLPHSDFPLPIKGNILADVSCALRYLHSLEPPLSFGDLKADHVFVSDDLRAKLDLGVKVFGAEFHTYGNVFDSQDDKVSYHLPPDFINAAFAEPKVRAKAIQFAASWDSFSFGVLCLHLLVQETPIPPVEALEVSSSDNEQVQLRTEEDRRSMYIEKLQGKENGFLPIIHLCLKNSPEQRPSSADLQDHVQKMCAGSCGPHHVLTASDCYDWQINACTLDRDIEKYKAERNQFYLLLSSAVEDSVDRLPNTDPTRSLDGYCDRRGQGAARPARSRHDRVGKYATDPSQYSMQRPFSTSNLSSAASTSSSSWNSSIGRLASSFTGGNSDSADLHTSSSTSALSSSDSSSVQSVFEDSHSHPSPKQVRHLQKRRVMNFEYDYVHDDDITEMNFSGSSSAAGKSPQGTTHNDNTGVQQESVSPTTHSSGALGLSDSIGKLKVQNTPSHVDMQRSPAYIPIEETSIVTRAPPKGRSDTSYDATPSEVAPATHGEGSHDKVEMAGNPAYVRILSIKPTAAKVNRREPVRKQRHPRGKVAPPVPSAKAQAKHHASK